MKQKEETGVSTMPPIETAIAVKKEELQSLAADYGKLVVTEGTLASCDNARKVLKETRRGIERVVETRKKTRLDWKRTEDKKDEDLSEAFLKIITPVEKKLEEGVNKLTEQKKAEVAAKIAAEEKRKRDIKNKIQALENRVSNIRASNSLTWLGEVADEISMERDSFEEFNEEGNGVVDMVLKTIENRSIVVVAEDEAALAATQARIKEQNAKEDTELEDIKEQEGEEKSREEVINDHAARMEEETVLPEERYSAPMAYTPDTYMTTPNSPPQRVKYQAKIEAYRFFVQEHSFVLPGSLSSLQANEIRAAIEKILA